MTRGMNHLAAARGFTLVELTVAATVTAICLAGVYGVLSRNLHLEAASTVRHRDRMAAQAVADSLAGAIEHAVIVKDVGITGGRQQGVSFLSCWVSSADGVSLPGEPSPFHRRLYRWNFPPGDGREGTIELKMILCAGERSLLPSPPPETATDDQALWDSVPPTVIGKGVKQVQVSYRDMSDPQASWIGVPSMPLPQMAARVRVTVGKETIERFVYPSTSVSAVQ